MPRFSAQNSQPDDLNTEIALFRFGLIAQIIHDPPPGGRQEALLRAIAAKTYQIPGSTRTRVSVTTLRRYLKTLGLTRFGGQKKRYEAVCSKAAGLR